MRARSFFYVAAGIFLLALSYHLGARSAGAQASGTSVVGFIAGPAGGAYTAAAITANGDVYATSISALDHFWAWRANIFSTATPTTPQTMGQLRARYR